MKEAKEMDRAMDGAKDVVAPPVPAKAKAKPQVERRRASPRRRT